MVASITIDDHARSPLPVRLDQSFDVACCEPPDFGAVARIGLGEVLLIAAGGHADLVDLRGGKP